MDPNAPSRLMAIALAFVAVIWVSPFAWLFSNAFDPTASGNCGCNGPSPRTWQLRRPCRAMPRGSSGIPCSFAAGTATLTVMVAAGAAYALSRMRIPGRNAFLWTLVLLRMLPTTGVLVPIYFRRSAGDCSTTLGIIVALSVLNLPFTLLLLKNFFDGVPVELEEAAHVEGASLWQILTPDRAADVAGGACRGVVLCLHRGLERIPVSADLRADRSLSFRCRSGFTRPSGHGAIDYGFLAAFSIIYAAPAVGVYFLLRRNMNTGFAGVGVKG
jgi:multiple sugar transport system permease protein